LYTCQPDGRWLRRTGLEETLQLPATACRLALADIYEKVEFE
jgi:hypothetical protein